MYRRRWTYHRVLTVFQAEDCPLMCILAALCTYNGYLEH
jgi:hypothetical protein